MSRGWVRLKTVICTWPGYVPNQLSGCRCCCYTESGKAAGKHINHLSIPPAEGRGRGRGGVCVCVCVLCKIVVGLSLRLWAVNCSLLLSPGNKTAVNSFFFATCHVKGACQHGQGEGVGAVAAWGDVEREGWHLLGMPN